MPFNLSREQTPIRILARTFDSIDRWVERPSASKLSQVKLNIVFMHPDMGEFSARTNKTNERNSWECENMSRRIQTK